MPCYTTTNFSKEVKMEKTIFKSKLGISLFTKFRESNEFNETEGNVSIKNMPKIRGNTPHIMGYPPPPPQAKRHIITPFLLDNFFLIVMPMWAGYNNAIYGKTI